MPETLNVDVACISDVSIREWIPLTAIKPPPKGARRTQKVWALPLVNKFHRELMEATMDPINRARILASLQKNRVYWHHHKKNLAAGYTLCLFLLREIFWTTIFFGYQLALDFELRYAIHTHVSAVRRLMQLEDMVCTARKE